MDVLNKSSGKSALRIGMGCKAQTAAIAGTMARICNAADRPRPQMHTARGFVQRILKFSSLSFSDRRRRATSSEWLFWAPSLLVVAMIAALYFYGPISQPLAYHHFADTRVIGSVPNGADVWSNLGFALVGLWGFVRLFPKRHQPQLRQGWPGYALFLLALVATAVGSAFYHWEPDNFRLIWDRLPIALLCAGLLAAVRCETHRSGEGWAAAAALGIIAIVSIAWWYVTGLYGQDDLRPYLLLQCLPLVLIPLWQSAYRAPVADRKAFLLAIGCYLLAKVVEFSDQVLFNNLHMISGHTLKHLFATLAAAVIVWRLTGRVKKQEAL